MGDRGSVRSSVEVEPTIQEENEAAVALAIMSDLTETPPGSRDHSPPFVSTQFLPYQSRRRNLSGEREFKIVV